MLSTHTHGQRCRGLKGNCRQQEEEEEGREGAALPLRTAAAHCSRRQGSGTPALPGSYGSLKGYYPPKAVGTAPVGPLALAAGRYEGAVSHAGVCQPQRLMSPCGELVGAPCVKLEGGRESR